MPVARSTEELVKALERHVRLLRDYATRAFRNGDFGYGGEIAGKLRLLVTKFGSNRPLLLDLMAQTGIAPSITLGGPPIHRAPGEPGPGDTISLARYLELTAMGVRIQSGQFVVLNKIQFIRAWAEQSGSSHEDWSHDPVLVEILTPQIFIGGLHGALAELATTTNAVLGVAERFLSEWQGRNREGDKDA